MVDPKHSRGFVWHRGQQDTLKLSQTHASGPLLEIHQRIGPVGRVQVIGVVAIERVGSPTTEGHSKAKHVLHCSMARQDDEVGPAQLRVLRFDGAQHGEQHVTFQIHIGLELRLGLETDASPVAAATIVSCTIGRGTLPCQLRELSSKPVAARRIRCDSRGRGRGVQDSPNIGLDRRVVGEGGGRGQVILEGCKGALVFLRNNACEDPCPGW